MAVNPALTTRQSSLGDVGRRTEPGTAKTFVIEVGPITSYGFGPADITQMERKLAREMDALIRSYWSVGKRSKVVRSRTELARGE